MNSLAPIDDINLKIFDEICEERFSQIELDVILVSIIDNLPSDALPHLAEQYHVMGNEGWSSYKKRGIICCIRTMLNKLHRFSNK